MNALVERRSCSSEHSGRKISPPCSKRQGRACLAAWQNQDCRAASARAPPCAIGGGFALSGLPRL